MSTAYTTTTLMQNGTVQNKATEKKDDKMNKNGKIRNEMNENGQDNEEQTILKKRKINMLKTEN